MNFVERAVRISGGARKVARVLGVHFSIVYRWIKHGSMENASYKHVAALSRLSGMPVEMLGTPQFDIEAHIAEVEKRGASR